MILALRPKSSWPDSKQPQELWLKECRFPSLPATEISGLAPAECGGSDPQFIAPSNTGTDLRGQDFITISTQTFRKSQDTIESARQ